MLSIFPSVNPLVVKRILARFIANRKNKEQREVFPFSYFFGDTTKASGCFEPFVERSNCLPLPSVEAMTHLHLQAHCLLPFYRLPVPPFYPPPHKMPYSTNVTAGILYQNKKACRARKTLQD